jgi:hypothetical protein
VIEHQKLGFKYQFEIVKDGVVVDAWEETNLMPTEGLNHVLNTVLKGGTPVTTWYCSLFEGNYTPLATDTAAAFPAAATECTAYDEAARVAITFGTVAAGAVDNSAAKAEFTFNATKTVYGGAIQSVSGKGATTGALLSAVKFATAKSMEAGAVLRVTAGLTLTST